MNATPASPLPVSETEGASSSSLLLPPAWPVRTRQARWGYVRRDGSWLVTPQFAWAAPFREGFARVNLGGHINREGAILGGSWGFLAADGSWAVPPCYEEAGDFSNGLAAVNRGASTRYVGQIDEEVMHGGRWGFIDIRGREIIRPQFHAVQGFSGGVAPANDGDTWGFIAADGSWEIVPRWTYARPFSEGRAIVSRRRNGENQWGFIDVRGDEVIPLRWRLARDFHQGRAWVLEGGRYRWGCLDLAGNVLLEAPEGVVEILPGPDGLTAAVRGPLVDVGGKWYPAGGDRRAGWLDARGQWLSQPEWLTTLPAYEGRARALHSGRWGFVDLQARWVIEPRFAAATDFEGGCAVGHEGDGQWVLVDRAGTVLARET